MEASTSMLVELASQPYFIGIVIATLLVLFFLKRYYNGAHYDIPKDADLQGKYVIITGGNTGVGKQTLIEMAKLKCHVIIGARDDYKSIAAIKEAKQISNNQNLEYLHLDLASKDSIQEFCNNVKFQKIDYLINNAGIMMYPGRHVTEEGIETHLGVNCLGHLYLTFLLWSKIKKSDFFRIINVSSLSHKHVVGWFYTPTLDFDDINFQKNYQKDLAYSRSKLAIVMVTNVLARMIAKNKLKGLVVSLHPGVVRTQILRYVKSLWYMNITLALGYPIHYMVSKSAQQGNYTTMYAALSKDIQNGKYYADCQQDSINAQVTDDNSNRLWEKAVELLGEKELKFD